MACLSHRLPPPPRAHASNARTVSLASFFVMLFSLSKVYNRGTAPFPYSTGCTATITFGTCDPATLVAEMNFPSQADPVALGVTPSNADSDAVQLVTRKTCHSELVVCRTRKSPVCFGSSQQAKYFCSPHFLNPDFETVNLLLLCVKQCVLRERR